ncbi:hypothetical protein OFB51_24480, partial [Escherichia coli]|nr:hypothetical protein [Escherichia coli]
INKTPSINIPTRPGKVFFNTIAALLTNNATSIREILLKKKFNRKKISKYIELFEEEVGIYKFRDNEFKINI